MLAWFGWDHVFLSLINNPFVPLHNLFKWRFFTKNLRSIILFSTEIPWMLPFFFWNRINMSYIVYVVVTLRMTHKVSHLHLFLFHNVAKLWTNGFFMKFITRKTTGRNLINHHIVCFKLIWRSLLIGMILLFPFLVLSRLEISMILRNLWFFHVVYPILHCIHLGGTVYHHLLHHVSYFFIDSLPSSFPSGSRHIAKLTYEKKSEIDQC